MQVILGQLARDRRRFFRLIGFGLLSLLFAAGFQTGFFPSHRVFGVIPDLTLCAVYLISCHYGCEAGGIAGIAGGFLLDCYGGSGIFILPLAYFTAGWFFGVSARNTGADASWVRYLLLLFPLLLFRGALTGVLTVLQNGIGALPGAIVRIVIPEMLATGIFAVLLYFPTRLLLRKRTRRDRDPK